MCQLVRPILFANTLRSTLDSREPKRKKTTKWRTGYDPDKGASFLYPSTRAKLDDLVPIGPTLGLCSLSACVHTHNDCSFFTTPGGSRIPGLLRQLLAVFSR